MALFLNHPILKVSITFCLKSDIEGFPSKCVKMSKTIVGSWALAYFGMRISAPGSSDADPLFVPFLVDQFCVYLIYLRGRSELGVQFQVVEHYAPAAKCRAELSQSNLLGDYIVAVDTGLPFDHLHVFLLKAGLVLASIKFPFTGKALSVEMILDALSQTISITRWEHRSVTKFMRLHKLLFACGD